jgi:hypothetical protein
MSTNWHSFGGRSERSEANKPKKLSRFTAKYSGKGLLPNLSFRIDEDKPDIKTLFLMENSRGLPNSYLDFITMKLKSLNSPQYVWQDFEWEDWNNSLEIKPVEFQWQNYQWSDVNTTIDPGTFTPGPWNNYQWQNVDTNINTGKPQTLPWNNYQWGNINVGVGSNPYVFEWQDVPFNGGEWTDIPWQTIPSSPAGRLPGMDWGSYNPPQFQEIRPPDWDYTEFGEWTQPDAPGWSSQDWTLEDWLNAGWKPPADWVPPEDFTLPPDWRPPADWTPPDFTNYEWTTPSGITVPPFEQWEPPSDFEAQPGWEVLVPNVDESTGATAYTFGDIPGTNEVPRGETIALDVVPPDAPPSNTGYIGIFCDPLWVNHDEGRQLIFSVTTFEAREEALTIQLQIGGNAVQGSDYNISGINADRIVSFNVGEQEKQFVVTPIVQGNPVGATKTITASIVGEGESFPVVLNRTASGAINQALPKREGEKNVVSEIPPGSYIPFFVITAEPTRIRNSEDESLVFTVRMVDLEGNELGITSSILCYLTIGGTAVEGTHYNFTDKVTQVGNASSDSVGSGQAIIEFKRGETSKVLTAVPIESEERLTEAVSIKVSISPANGFSEGRNPFIEAGESNPPWLDGAGTATGWIAENAISAALTITSPYTPPEDTPYINVEQINYGNASPVILSVAVELDSGIEAISEFALKLKVMATAIRLAEGNATTADFFIEPEVTPEYNADSRAGELYEFFRETGGDAELWEYYFKPGMFNLMTSVEERTGTLDIPIYVNLDYDIPEEEQEPRYLAFKPISMEATGENLKVYWENEATQILLFVVAEEETTCIFKVMLPGGKMEGFFADENLGLDGYEPVIFYVESEDSYAAILKNGQNYAFVNTGTLTIKEINGLVAVLGATSILNAEEWAQGVVIPDIENVMFELPNQQSSVGGVFPNIGIMESSHIYVGSAGRLSTSIYYTEKNSEETFVGQRLTEGGRFKTLFTLDGWINDNTSSYGTNGQTHSYAGNFSDFFPESFTGIDRYKGKRGCSIYTHIFIANRAGSFHSGGDIYDKMRLHIEIEAETHKIVENLTETTNNFYAFMSRTEELTEGSNTLNLFFFNFFSPSVLGGEVTDFLGKIYGTLLLSGNPPAITDPRPNDAFRFGLSNNRILSNIPAGYTTTPELAITSNLRNGYSEPPTDVYVYEIANGMAKRWDGTVTSYAYTTTTDIGNNILVNSVRLYSGCTVTLSNPQLLEFHALANLGLDCALIEPKNNSTLFLTDYVLYSESFFGQNGINSYLFNLGTEESPQKTMEVSIAKVVTEAQEEQAEWYADRYRFNKEQLKWERLPNLKGKLSAVTGATSCIAAFPLGAEEDP